MASTATASTIDDFQFTPIKPSDNDANLRNITEYGPYNQDRIRVEQMLQNQDAKLSADGVSHKTPASEPNVVFGPIESPWKAPKEISVREMDFEQFKNRYGMDDKYHIIEILIGTLQTADEIQNELNRRREGSGHKFNPLEEDKNISSDAEWIQRVRIQSPTILRYLRHVAGGPGQYIEKPRVFLRPFEALELSFSDMKQHMEALEARWGEVVQLEDAGRFEDASVKQKQIEIERKLYRDIAKKKRNNLEIESKFNKRDMGEKTRDIEIQREPYTYRRRRRDYLASDRDDSTSTGSDASDDGRKNISTEVGGDDIDINDPKLDNPTALRHMRCYINFVEKRILALQQALRDPLSGRIRSNDLWHLFQVGDVIHTPRKSILQQATFVVHGKSIPETLNRNIDDLNNIGLTINCHYVDNNGDGYEAFDYTFTIEGYEGESAIIDLPAYPLFCAHDYEQRQTELRKQGEQFMAMTLEKHVYCRSWTLPYDPLGNNGAIKEKTVYSPSEYVDSDVIIDIAEALKQNSDWMSQNRMTWSHIPGHVRDDEIEICHWSDERRTELWLSTAEEMYRHGNPGSLMWENFEQAVSSVGPFDVVGRWDNILRSGSLILPRRFFVYVLRERKFVGVDVMTMEKIPPQETIFDDLQIDPDNKKMVKSLVAEHFQKRELQRIRPGIGFINQDLIRGKGSGLFILLHGVPGVGKTATAEAVAQANDKPLFAITCGDLGFTPKEVEEELNSIFRLANKWDCVLLLDEVFLARRDTWNLKRNALVSVFLRVLEYYSGILFLTTNRVGTIDEAFKSRIHITLYYEPLTREQTFNIFRVNIEKLKKIEQDKEMRLKESVVDYPKLKIEARDIARWALHYYDEAGVTNDFMRWNGRQIRNAFQIASSLARYDTAKFTLGGDTVPFPVLDSSHFDLVAQAIEKFDTYMQHATGMADSDHARIEGTRADELRLGRDTQNRSSTAAANRKRGTQLGTPKQPRVQSREQDVKRPGTMPIRGNTVVPSSRQQTSRNAVPSSSRSQARAFEYPTQSHRLGPRGKQRVDEFDDEDEAMEASYMNNASLEEGDMDDEDYGDGNQDFYDQL